MRLGTLALSLAPLVTAASLAHAQAPGEVDPQPVQPVTVQPITVQPVVVAPVVAQPVVVAPVVAPPAPAPAPAAAPMAPAFGPVIAEAPCARDSVMASRWAIGLAVGSMSLAPESSPDDQTAFALGELSLRFRATRHLELELAVGGGRERTADDQEGDLEVTTAAFAARYRFRPEAAWNWFVMAGLGGASITRHDATRQERDDAMQPLGMLGIGLERRFRHLALQAELRAVGLGQRDEDAVEPRMAEGAVMTPSTSSADIARSGGSLTLGLSYYF